MIWPFKKTRRHAFSPREAIPSGLVDVHSHILWGLDDGPASPEASDEMCRVYRELGYRTVVATPHHNHSMFDDPGGDAIRSRISRLAERNPEGPEILAGGEIMFDDTVWDRIAAGELPTLGPSKTYLVEFSPHPGGIPPGLDETIFRFQLKEIAVLIAHCERYPELASDRERLERLRTAGAIVQVNTMSLAGRYGRTHMKTAWSLLEEGLVDLLATDLHNPADARWILDALEEAHQWDPRALERLVSTNPGAVAAGDPWSVKRDA